VSRSTSPALAISSTSPPGRWLGVESRPAAVLIAGFAGSFVAIQARINGAFGRAIDDARLAACVSFGVGLIGAILLVLPSNRARAGVGLAARSLREHSLHWWQLLGGLGGALYVLSQTVTVATLGVALFTVCIVAGQTGNSLVVDEIGLAPGGRRAITPNRIAAAVLAVIAVVIGVSDRLDSSSFRLAFVLLVILAGAGAAFQQAFNAHVARAAQNPAVSSLVNFTVGFVALVVVTALLRIGSSAPFPTLPAPWSGHWWYYIAGPLGLLYTLGLAMTVRTLGVLLFGLCSIAGQLIGAVVVDLVAPTAGASVTWELLVAVALTCVAGMLAAGLLHRPRVTGSRA
jgi:bacterial/archaeal transporter family-2 protein